MLFYAQCVAVHRSFIQLWHGSAAATRNTRCKTNEGQRKHSAYSTVATAVYVSSSMCSQQSGLLQSAATLLSAHTACKQCMWLHLHQCPQCDLPGVSLSQAARRDIGACSSATDTTQTLQNEQVKA